MLTQYKPSPRYRGGDGAPLPLIVRFLGTIQKNRGVPRPVVCTQSPIVQFIIHRWRVPVGWSLGVRLQPPHDNAVCSTSKVPGSLAPAVTDYPLMDTSKQTLVLVGLSHLICIWDACLQHVSTCRCNPPLTLEFVPSLRIPIQRIDSRGLTDVEHLSKGEFASRNVSFLARNEKRREDIENGKCTRGPRINLNIWAYYEYVKAPAGRALREGIRYSGSSLAVRVLTTSKTD
ncbi:hypothetical protein EVAR_57416_1 [Eumeta japonica]|uniref:Uncharacterized protein n=1 Tax=Eumeta variegata TaxID=151549 RepID=A0A4C2A2U7_EUMVA|nr:hypothetical protein EVAR_57416_1 [Eumeta japonica]